jgi:N-acetylmuramoyl-L-alanine amidase
MLLREYVQSTACGTGPIRGLTNQVFATLNAGLPPGTLVDISAHVQSVGSSTLPFVQRVGAEALIAAIEQKGQKLPLIHALRVLPQQFALRHWALHDRCEITAAAPPSKSNHEGANAIDVKREFIASWKSVLNQHGWIQTVLPHDPAHFDFTGEHDPVFVRKAVLAFQKLWNTHNPNDLIAEDGGYGTETERRLKASPIAGF